MKYQMSMIHGGMRMAITGQSVVVLLFAALLTGSGSNSPGGWGVRSVEWSQSTTDKPPQELIMLRTR
jgi:hypothetical protein